MLIINAFILIKAIVVKVYLIQVFSIKASRELNSSLIKENYTVSKDCKIPVTGKVKI